jgi:hypothetical protein
MTTSVPTIGNRRRLEDAMRILQEKAAPAVAVIDAAGRLDPSIRLCRDPAVDPLRPSIAAPKRSPRSPNVLDAVAAFDHAGSRDSRLTANAVVPKLVHRGAAELGLPIGYVRRFADIRGRAPRQNRKIRAGAGTKAHPCRPQGRPVGTNHSFSRGRGAVQAAA